MNRLGVASRLNSGGVTHVDEVRAGGGKFGVTGIAVELGTKS
jgi:hypothetical protein